MAVRPSIAARAGMVLALAAAAVAVPGTAQAGQAAAVGWSACTESTLTGFDCATYEVPLDYDRPGGPTTTIALARRPADDQAHKLGTIFVNPGGPGGAGRDLVTAAARIVRPEVLARFDFVGFDPRGIGASDPIQCFATDEEAEALLSRMRSVPITKAEIAETLAANWEYTEGCKRNAGPLLTHMSTLNVAKDLDRLRQAVGDRALTYIGFSYGTMIGATYVNLFPGKVRAVIIDGNVDPDQRANNRLVNKFERAGGFEIALAGFFRECDKAGPNCALAGNSKAKFTKIRERFRQGPVTSATYGEVTIDDLTGFVAGSMYDVASFPETAQVLQILYSELFGGPSALRATPAPPMPSAPPARGGSTDAYEYTSNDAFYAVNCADAPLPRNPKLYPVFAEVFERANPTFGRSEAFGEVGCANWPKVTERYAGPWNKRTANTVLVVNGTYDPATRYDFGKRMTRELGNARLLTLDGFGHTSRYSACVQDWYTTYLLGGQLPPVGARCAQDLPPFPAAAS